MYEFGIWLGLEAITAPITVITKSSSDISSAPNVGLPQADRRNRYSGRHHFWLAFWPHLWHRLLSREPWSAAMARDIDQIVETYEKASALRAAGLPVWNRTINIKDVLRSDQSNSSEEHAAWVANQIGSLLRRGLPEELLDWSNTDTEALEIVDGFEALRPDSYADDRTYTAPQDLNDMLARLYDWADRERVWLG